MKPLLEHAIGFLVGQALRKKIKSGSLKAVKSYIQLIKAVRRGTLYVAGLAAVVSILVSGLVLFVIGIVQILPVNPAVFPYLLMGFGGLCMLLAVGVLSVVFNEKVWLKESKAYDMMDTVLKPWPDGLPIKATQTVSKSGQISDNPTWS